MWSWDNVIADIAPAKGHRILMQTQPGWVHSGSDFDKFRHCLFLEPVKASDGGFGTDQTCVGDESKRPHSRTSCYVRARSWPTISRVGRKICDWGLDKLARTF